VTGFVVVVDDEVEQVYVDRSWRGRGVAELLLRHAEAVIGQGGRRTAWLAVVAGNTRARRFYARLGWRDHGPFTYQARRRPARSRSPPTATSTKSGTDEHPRSPRWQLDVVGKGAS
jgi:RimJ/RimL family protein N-acetyltransferase